jgi:hypothetical protein
MPALKNPRHEAFAQAIFKGLADGLTQGECYLAAGYGGQRKGKDAARFHASRLLHKYGILERVRELQEQAAKAKKATVDTIVDELETARQIARENKQASAMVSASTAKAKILGLEINRTEIGRPGDFNVRTKQELAERYLTNAGADNITDYMREAMLAELERHLENTQAIASQKPSIN